MEQKQISSLRKVWVFSLLVAMLLCVSCFATAPYASAASTEGSDASAMPNTLSLNVKAPEDFHDTLWVTLFDVGKGQELVVKIDFKLGSDIKFQLAEGTYKVVKAYAERQPDRYTVTFDTTEFTIGDGTSPSILLDVQKAPESEPTSEPSSDVPTEPDPDVPSEPSEDTTTEPEPDPSTEPSEPSEPTVPEEPSESPEPPDDSEDDDNEDDNSNSSGILKRVYNAILSIAATAVFICLVAVIVYFVRHRSGED